MTWQAMRLGDFLQLEYGKPLPSDERDPSGRYAVYGANGEKARSNRYFHNKQSIVVGRKGSAGEIRLTEEKFWPLDVTYFATFDESRYDLKFLYYLLGTLDLPSMARGVKPGINRNDVYSLNVSIPALREQRRIVAILDEAFAGIATAKANAEKSLRNARQIFVGYLDALLDACGDVEERRLGDLVTRLTNGYVGPIKSVYVESGIPYLLARHVRDNKLAFDGKTFITDEFNQKNRKSILKGGDVLLVQSGHIGHSAVVTEEHEGHNCHAMIVITPVEGVMTGEFLSLLFNSARMRSEFDAIRSGSTVPHLTCKEVRAMAIKLPDLARQERMVAKSKELQAETNHLESLYTRKLAALDELKQSLLQQAFSGDL